MCPPAAICLWTLLIFRWWWRVSDCQTVETSPCSRSYMCTDICEHQDSDCVQSCSESTISPAAELDPDQPQLPWHLTGQRSEVRRKSFKGSNLNKQVISSGLCVCVCTWYLSRFREHLFPHSPSGVSCSICFYSLFFFFDLYSGSRRWCSAFQAGSQLNQQHVV